MDEKTAITTKKEKQPTIYISRFLFIWLVVVSVLSPLAVSGFSVWYTSHSQKVNDERWCDLLVSLDQPYPPNPKVPITPRGIIIQRKLHDLRINLAC